MAKQQVSHKYIMKINSSRLRKAKWNLTLSLAEARRNDELIALNDSQMLRWIDELNGVHDIEEKVREIRAAIRAVRKLPQSPQNRREIKRLYAEQDKLQFKPDYMDLVIDKDSDLFRACKGFKINGVKYTRLLGTSGGVKNSTIVFVSERLAPELRKRIDNGRDQTVPMIPAKFEAYRALTCSGSTPVSMPNGILVVNDCETCFKEDVIMLNDEKTVEPDMQYIKDFEIKLTESDGYGLMLPSLAKRWSEELMLDYTASGMNTRLSFEKGMVFTFDFIAFADKVAGGQHIVKDVWGHDVDITKVELILTASMLKLWDCYKSIEHYLSCCAENHYTFNITKTTPKELEDRRALNYQFIQSYDLTDEQIMELIQPTVDELHDVVHGDYRKAILFLGGSAIADNVMRSQSGRFSACDAMIADKRMFDDPYVRKSIYRQVEHRIQEAKIGVIDVHGNYSILCGDPYALCQSIWGLPVTGLLKAGQLYNKYWLDHGTKELACFRAPMSCHNNIKRLKVACTDEMAYWYQYMTTCTMLNAWDSTTQALNGADKDGDLIFLTDNRVLVDNIKPTPAIFCVQRKGVKKIVTEEDLIVANIASFGNDIGKITNRVTSMFDVRAQFPEDSEEYRILSYRIMSGQLFQQNAIDKAKGIVCKPMPRSWYDVHAAIGADGGEPGMNYRILADKKSFFMRYIYQTLMRQYNTYIKNTDRKCMREFGVNIAELLESGELTDEQATFIRYYKERMPVGNNDSVMNRLCRMVERSFGGAFKMQLTSGDFDPSILKSEAEYTDSQYYAIYQLYKEHKRRLVEETIESNKIRFDDSDNANFRRENLCMEFIQECRTTCSNGAQLCNILVDMCYGHEGTKQLAWDVCAAEILENLRNANGRIIHYPVPADDGEITYLGKRYTMVEGSVA